jgi:hypothetical protein
MAYPLDLVGKVAHFKVPGDGGPVIPSQIVNGTLTGRTSLERVIVQSTANVLNNAAAVIPQPPWSFTFLKYVPGYVTVAPLNGNLLTGPMSGCYIFKYTEGVSTMVAHVGTANHETSELSVDAKNAWTAFAARPEVSEIIGGKPDDYFKPGEIAAAMPQGSQILPQTCCYYDGMSFFSILLVPQPRNLGASALKVAGVKQMTMQPWDTIRVMRTFLITEAEDKVKDRKAFRLGST